VGQIAKLKGCRTIGIAGGEKKCAWLTDVAKFDGAIDYKSEDVSERIGALCPNKWDIFFDNVAGPIPRGGAESPEPLLPRGDVRRHSPTTTTSSPYPARTT
jgi:NADPH-dependent curcumin reductase CurA